MRVPLLPHFLLSLVLTPEPITTMLPKLSTFNPIHNAADHDLQEWAPLTRLPWPVALRTALTFYIDITTPPTQEILASLATLATDSKDVKKINKLVDVSMYKSYTILTDVRRPVWVFYLEENQTSCEIIYPDRLAYSVSHVDIPFVGISIYIGENRGGGQGAIPSSTLFRKKNNLFRKAKNPLSRF